MPIPVEDSSSESSRSSSPCSLKSDDTEGSQEVEVR